MYCVYIVAARDGTYYAGSTNNLPRRLALHNSGRGAKYLRGRGPVQLVYLKAFRSQKRAMQVECALKKLTRPQKEQIIRARHDSCHCG